VCNVNYFSAIGDTTENYSSGNMFAAEDGHVQTTADLCDHDRILLEVLELVLSFRKVEKFKMQDLFLK